MSILRLSELTVKNPNAAQAFIEEYGRRLARHVAFLVSEESLRAVWQGEVEVMLSEYNAREARWSIEEDVYGDAFTPEMEEALEQAFSWDDGDSTSSSITSSKKKQVSSEVVGIYSVESDGIKFIVKSAYMPPPAAVFDVIDDIVAQVLRHHVLPLFIAWEGDNDTNTVKYIWDGDIDEDVATDISEFLVGILSQDVD